jgi:hypothetical protein
MKQELTIDTVECMNCYNVYESYIIISEGMPLQLFCSGECAYEYYKPIDIKRDEKINLILE